MGCKGKEVAHSGADPEYPLRGLHVAVPCEGCHGPGTPNSLPENCIDCHNDDRPGLDHYPGLDCAECHVEEGFEIVETEPTITDPTPVPNFDHTKLPETQLCWECHEKERKDLSHYALGGPLDAVTSWDCAGCHTATAWDWEPIEHPARIPHGVENGPDDCAPRPADQWETGCIGCHPNGTDTFECFTCHREPDDPKEPIHGGTWELAECLLCHVDAEPDNCVD